MQERESGGADAALSVESRLAIRGGGFETIGADDRGWHVLGGRLMWGKQGCARDRHSLQKDGIDGVIGGDVGQRVLFKQEQVGALADLDGSNFRCQPEGKCIVEGGTAKQQRQWSAGIGPLLQFQAAVQAGGIAKTVTGGRVASEQQRDM